MENHSHDHHSHSISGKIGLAFWLNLVFAIGEFFGGLFTNSLAISSDALHDFGDAISLALSWFLERKSQQKRSDSYTYGYGRFSLLGAVITGTILLVGSVIIAFNAIPRVIHPEAVNVKGIFVFAIFGIAINGAAAFKLMNTSSKNAKFVFYHLLEDVLGWAAVLVSSIVMHFVNAPFIDPLLAILIVLYVLFNVVRNLFQTITLFLQRVPDGFDVNKIRSELSKKYGCNVHDVHLWTIDGEENVFSAHVAIKNCSLKDSDKIKSEIKDFLSHKGIAHSTIEVEFVGKKCEQINC